MTMFASCRELLTVRDSARWIRDQTGIAPSVETIHRWMRKGVRGRVLQSRRIGGVWYISPDDLASFLKYGNKREPAAHSPELPVRAAIGVTPTRRRQIRNAKAELMRRLGRAQ